MTNRTFEDRPATRERVPLLAGIVGPSSSGKTFSALRLATGMQQVTGGDIYLIDTEARRSLHYADRFKFRHLEFSAPFSPLDYLAAIAPSPAEVAPSANAWEAAARVRKASLIVAALRSERVGMSAAQAAEAAPWQRELAAQIAGTTVPSEATWGLVIDLLRRHEALDAAGADPLDGLVA